MPKKVIIPRCYVLSISNQLSSNVTNTNRELAYKTQVAKCLTTVANQPYLRAASKGYSHSKWLSIEQDMLFR